MTSAVLLPAIGLVFLSGQAASPDSVLMRFDPAPGARIHRVFQAHTRMMASVPDTTAGNRHDRVREAVDLGGMTQVTVAAPDGKPLVHLAFDSLRAFARDDGKEWRTYASNGIESAWIQLRLDERMRVLGTAAGGDRPGSGMLVQLLTGVPSLELPDGWVRTGDRWTSELQVPLRESLGRGAVGLPTTTLVSQTTIVVDSVVPRSNDTLAYLSVTGAFAPTAVTEPSGERVRFTGGLSGTLVWSTGWGTIVSSATRTRVQVATTRQRGTPGQPSERVTLETTIREQVQP